MENLLVGINHSLSEQIGGETSRITAEWRSPMYLHVLLGPGLKYRGETGIVIPLYHIAPRICGTKIPLQIGTVLYLC